MDGRRWKRDEGLRGELGVEVRRKEGYGEKRMEEGRKEEKGS